MEAAFIISPSFEILLVLSKVIYIGLYILTIWVGILRISTSFTIPAIILISASTFKVFYGIVASLLLNAFSMVVAYF